MTNTETEKTGQTEETLATEAKNEVEETAAKVEDKSVLTEGQTEAIPNETPAELIKQFSLEVTKDQIDKDFEEALAKYASEISIPGFRKGKVPLDIIKARFNDVIKDEVINKILEKNVFDQIEKEGLHIASQPTVDKMDEKENGDFTAEVSVEIFPEVEIPELETVEVEIAASELKYEPYDEAKQIDAVLEGNRKQSPVIDRGVVENDYVVIKYQSKVLSTRKMFPKKQTYFIAKDGEEFEIPEFYKEIIGKNRDESFTFTRTFPADYKKKPLAGQEVEFNVTVVNIFELVKPELNENFVKSIGFEDENTFKEKLKGEYEQYNSKMIEDKKMGFILDKLVETISFPVPGSAVAHEAEHIYSHYRKQFGLPEGETPPALIEPFKKEAEKSVRVSLITSAVRKKYNIEVTSDDLENEYKEMSEKNRIPVKEIRKYFMSKENSQQLKDRLLKDKISGLIKEKIVIKEI